MFPADEDATSLTRALNAPIPIVDDSINEVDEQYFFAKLECFDGVNVDSIKQDFAMVVIGDNDGMLQDCPFSTDCDFIITVILQIFVLDLPWNCMNTLNQVQGR